MGSARKPNICSSTPVCYTPTEFREVIAEFDSGSVDPAPMLGPVLGLDRIAEAFDLTRAAQAHGRVLIRPTDACLP